ncbi:MAG: sensor histidine kinase [Terriglobia bacterium]
MNRIKLRTKLLLSLIFISSLLACSSVLIVRARMERKARRDIDEGLSNSVVTFVNFQRRRDAALASSARLLADLPIVRALMTTQDAATIQDASREIWQLAGSDLFVLADRAGEVVALHAVIGGFTIHAASGCLHRALAQGGGRDWWFDSGHLYEVFLEPVYFGRQSEGVLLGELAVGYLVAGPVAREVSQIASSQVAFRYGAKVVVTTLAPNHQAWFQSQLARVPDDTHDRPVDIQLGGERYVVASLRLTPDRDHRVSLVVLKSYDRATAFVHRLDRWLWGVGLFAVLAGVGLAFAISHTVTRPLDDLISGVRALEKGNFSYPLLAIGRDEVAELTGAFQRMRDSLQATQNELLRAERLATIGLMASAISHDLRHPLAVILAYAEFLSERNLPEAQRREFYDEIRQAVNRMSDLTGSLLELSKARQKTNWCYCSAEDSVRRVIQSVQAQPDFRRIGISVWREGRSEAWLDPVKLERVLHNLLLNACQAVSPESGLIEVRIGRLPNGTEVRVTDNGPGIPEPIRHTMFQPFVSYGKENGTGLGLAVAQKMVQDQGGMIEVEQTGPGGTTFRLTFPALSVPPEVTAQ